MLQALCGKEVVQSLTAAREAVDGYLRNTFQDIKQLQESDSYLQNVQSVQARTRDLATWNVQREQLSAVEACATNCTCDDSAQLVVQEYNTLAGSAGLPAVGYASPMQLWPSVLIIFLAFAGFILAWYLGHKKRTPEPMICPLKGDCAAVIRSEFSSFLGIPVERLGLLYYALVALLYGALLIWPEAATPVVVLFAVGVSLSAFLFSAYLTFIQLGFIQEICTWCLLSAFFSTAIFFVSLFGSHFVFVPLLAAWQPVIAVMYFVGLVLGVGAVTFTDIFFFKFLKDLKISQDEAGVLRTVSQVMWAGLGLLVINGAALYLLSADHSSQFWARMIVMTVIMVNNSFLNLKIAPHLIRISFGDDPRKNSKEELRSERRVAFALGAVSLVSWYTVLILSVIPKFSISLSAWLLGYVLTTGAAVVISQVAERYFGRKPMNSHGPTASF